jgi:alkanesulfonate monooxygenase SsuD/methylene tetrahydromethanopterin reductase-like flavin-dependent oxidoreductase (luciferase family)
LADLDIAEWMIKTVRGAAEAAGRDPDAIKFCIGAPMYVGDGDDPIAREHMINQCRWFGGMVGNHVADIVSKYGGGSDVPAALTDYIAGRENYDYNSHGRATNTHTDFVPDEIVERFCIIGSPKEHIAKLNALKDLGVHQFAGYLQHDNKDATLAAYGNEIIPAVRDVVLARS